MNKLTYPIKTAMAGTTTFLVVAGMSYIITISAIDVKTKHSAVIIFIGSYSGTMLLKTGILKYQPIKSEILMIAVNNKDIQIIILNE